jgi:hypothetical protein
MRKQQGISLTNLIVWLAVLGFLFVMGAKLMPAYIEYFKVKKVFAAMEQGGILKSSVRDIRYDFDKRNAIEDITSIRSEDLTITKEGGETILAAEWSVKVPLVSNASACLDFSVTTAK